MRGFKSSLVFKALKTTVAKQQEQINSFTEYINALQSP